MEQQNNDNKSDSSNYRKFIEFKLKSKKIKEKSEIKYFDKITDVLLSFNILPFLKENEVKTCGSLDIKFYNAFIRFCERRYNSLDLLYNIKLNNKQMIDQNELYEQKDDKGHYIKLGIFSVNHYSLFSENIWTWRDDKRYWNKIAVKNSILNKEIYELNMVCWIDVNQSVTHVFYGKYKLYLNHCVCNLPREKLKLTVFLDETPIFETKYPSQELKNKCREKHALKDEGNNRDGAGVRRGGMGYRGLRIPMKDRFKIDFKEKRVDKDFITDIEIPYNEKIDKTMGHKITVRFDHVEGSWKQGWMIDAFILEKIIENVNDK